MMTRRVQVNLAVFLLLGSVLTVWAVRNVLKLDPFSRPYQITAQFERSPGLQPGFDVTYLGVAVGRIQNVRLQGKKVHVQLAIDKGWRLPRGLTAAAALKSAIGEPYVDLEPGTGQADAPPMRPGEVIPVARTSVTMSYGDLFAAVNKTITGLDPNKLRTVTRELALGLDGRGESLRMSVDGASQLADTFARNTGTLDGLITNLGSLTRVLAAQRGDLGTGISSTAALTSSLAELDASLVRIRDTTPDLLARTDKLLRESKPAMECILGTMGAAAPVILTDRTIADYDEGMRWAPELSAAMRGAITYVNGNPNLNVKFVFTPGPTKQPREYKNLRPLPGIPRIPTCAGVPLPKKQKPTVSKPKPAAKQGAEKSPTAAPSQVPVRNTAAGERDGGTPWPVYLPPVLAALILLGVVLNLLGARPFWRRRSE